MPRRRNGEIPLPDGWDFARDFESGKVYFIDHIAKKTTWMDPRDRFTKPQTFADCIGNELPLGWEEAFDGQIGPYFINHVNETTQLEDPRQEWRAVQEAMLRDYLQTAQDVLEAKKDIYQVKKQRLILAQNEYDHLNNALATLGTSRTSLCSSSSSVSTKYDPDLLKSDVALAKDRVSRLKCELEQIRTEMTYTQRGVDTLTNVEQKLTSSSHPSTTASGTPSTTTATTTCYNIAEAQAIMTELRHIQRSLTSGEKERADLMQSLAKLKDDLTRLQLCDNSSPDVSTLSLSQQQDSGGGGGGGKHHHSQLLNHHHLTEKSSTASQTDLSCDLVPIGTRLAEMARKRLEYDEARKMVQCIQHKLADMEEKVQPGEEESDKDRLLLFQEKEQLLRELRSITPRNRTKSEMTDIAAKCRHLEDDLRKARELSNRAITDRLRLHEEKQLLLQQLRDALRTMTQLESQLKTLSASTLSVSSSSSLGSLSTTSSKGSLSSGLSFTDIYGGPQYGTGMGQCVDKPVDMVDLHRRVERLLKGDSAPSKSPARSQPSLSPRSSLSSVSPPPVSPMYENLPCMMMTLQQQQQLAPPPAYDMIASGGGGGGGNQQPQRVPVPSLSPLTDLLEAHVNMSQGSGLGRPSPTTSRTPLPPLDTTLTSSLTDYPPLSPISESVSGYPLPPLLPSDPPLLTSGGGGGVLSRTSSAGTTNNNNARGGVGVGSVSAAVSDESVAGDSGVFEASSASCRTERMGRRPSVGSVKEVGVGVGGGGSRNDSTGGLSGSGCSDDTGNTGSNTDEDTAQVQIKLCYLHSEDLLSVCIEQARNLTALFVPDDAQVYIKAVLLPALPLVPAVCCTRAVIDLRQPTFGDIFNISVPSSKIYTKTLQINVWCSENNEQEKCIGCAQVSLADFDPNHVSTKWYNILSLHLAAETPIASAHNLNYTTEDNDEEDDELYHHNPQLHQLLNDCNDYNYYNYNSNDEITTLNNNNNNNNTRQQVMSSQSVAVVTGGGIVGGNLREESSDDSSTVISSQTSTLTRDDQECNSALLAVQQLQQQYRRQGSGGDEDYYAMERIVNGLGGGGGEHGRVDSSDSEEDEDDSDCVEELLDDDEDDDEEDEEGITVEFRPNEPPPPPHPHNPLTVVHEDEPHHHPVTISCDKQTNTECNFYPEHAKQMKLNAAAAALLLTTPSTTNSPSNTPMVIIKRSQTFSPPTHNSYLKSGGGSSFSSRHNKHNYVCKLNRSDSDGAMPLYRKAAAGGSGAGGSVMTVSGVFQRGALERRSLRLRRQSAVAVGGVGAGGGGSSRPHSVVPSGPRTSIDLELDLQAQHTRLHMLNSDLTRLRDLKHRLEAARERGDLATAQWALEDRQFLQLVAQAQLQQPSTQQQQSSPTTTTSTGTSQQQSASGINTPLWAAGGTTTIAEERRVEKLVRKVAREIYRLRKSKAGHGKPDVISFKEKMAFFTRVNSTIPFMPEDDDDLTTVTCNTSTSTTTTTSTQCNQTDDDVTLLADSNSSRVQLLEQQQQPGQLDVTGATGDVVDSDSCHRDSADGVETTEQEQPRYEYVVDRVLGVQV